MLARLRGAFADQPRFAQDAAHELRTPIAALTLQMESVCGDPPPGACAESFAWRCVAASVDAREVRAQAAHALRRGLIPRGEAG
ncbi:MAG: hypothetical protein ACYC0T_10345 [Ramlibacter sp.]